MFYKTKWIGIIAIASSLFTNPVFAEPPIKIGLGGPDKLVKSQFSCGLAPDTPCVICVDNINDFEQRVLLIANNDSARGEARTITGLKAYFVSNDDEVLYSANQESTRAPIVGEDNPNGIQSIVLDYAFNYEGIPKCHPEPKKTQNDAILAKDESCTFGVWTSDSGLTTRAPKIIYIKGHKQGDSTVETTKFYVSVAIGDCD